MTERECLVAIYAFLPFGPARVDLLLKYFGSAIGVWKASSKELSEIGLKKDTVQKFELHRKKFNPEAYFNRLDKLSISYLTFKDENYPNNLAELTNAPIVLYYKGNIKASDEFAIAIVGTRKMTSYGREVTERFAAELASVGVTIVSGLAIGIDAVAHKVAIEVGGRSIAVVASGLDRISPVTNKWIADKIINENLGAVVSEYPLGYPSFRTNFANRNRIISGLSKAVLVIEGRRQSGTFLTVSAAADQGRSVFAVPGQITSPMSEAPHYLIQNGAKIAFSPKDILDEMDMQLKVDKEAVERALPSTKDEEKLLQILANEPLHLDEISREMKAKISDVSATLTTMELKGLVKNLGGGVYKVS